MLTAVTAEGLAVPAVSSVRTAVRPVATEPASDRPALDALVGRAAQGDRSAQRALFSELRPRIVRHVSFLLRRRAEVDDVVQEVFLEIFRSLRSFEGRSSFSTWVHRITVRATYRHMRRHWKGAPPPEAEADADLAEPPAEADPARGAEVRDRHARVLRILDQLSPKKRMVLVLHDLEGVEAAEIAKLVGAPVLTVRTRLFYARKELAAAARSDPALAEYFEEDEGGPQT